MTVARRPLARLGAVALSLVAVGALSACSLLGQPEAQRDDTGAVTEATDAGASTLRVGDCMNTAELTGSFSTVPTVPCTDEHDSVIIKVVTLTDEQTLALPGTTDFIHTECSTALEAWTPTTGELADWQGSYFEPDAAAWAAGDRTVQCLAVKG